MALVDWLREDVEYADVTAFGGPPQFLRASPTREQKREALIRLARDSYVGGDLTVEEFEASVAEILACAPDKPWKRA
jgi:hypothetical protein